MSKHKVKGIDSAILHQAFIDSFKKLNPKILIKNPVIFVVEIGFFLTLLLYKAYQHKNTILFKV